MMRIQHYRPFIVRLPGLGLIPLVLKKTCCLGSIQRGICRLSVLDSFELIGEDCYIFLAFILQQRVSGGICPAHLSQKYAIIHQGCGQFDELLLHESTCTCAVLHPLRHNMMHQPESSLLRERVLGAWDFDSTSVMQSVAPIADHYSMRILAMALGNTAVLPTKSTGDKKRPTQRSDEGRTVHARIRYNSSESKSRSRSASPHRASHSPSSEKRQSKLEKRSKGAHLFGIEPVQGIDYVPLRLFYGRIVLVVLNKDAGCMASVVSKLTEASTERVENTLLLKPPAH
ncbi:unnamed protein product [Gongylonema pulchrum]|uniref:Uncharacterized protein n=1 Tax=Gongylonema pulchrum TaxID=637853 RepID=A0A183DR15_9BILA|nr:unnamed protein product [Gongylonema pulchrum]